MPHGAWENYIFNPFTRHRYLARVLPSEDQADARRIERILAVARLFLAPTCLLATWLDPTKPTGAAGLSYAWLCAYIVYALIILVLLRRKPVLRPGSRLAIHSVDLIAVTVFTIFTLGPHTAFYALFIFVLLSAAFRWGFRETAATALAAGVLIFLENAFVEGSHIHRQWMLWTPIVPNFVMPAIYLLIQGLIAGILAVEVRRLLAESSTIARIMAGIDPDAELARTLRKVGNELYRIFGAGRILLAVQENNTLHVWGVVHRDTGGTLVHVTHIEPADKGRYLFDAPASSWSVLPWRMETAALLHTRLELDSRGEGTRKEVKVLPAGFQAAHPCSSLLIDSVTLGRMFVRLFLLDPAPEMRGFSGVQFLHNLFSRLAPAVFDIYRARRARTETSVLERASLARELHDGTIQSLIAIEVELQILRQRAEREGSGADAQLESIQENLRHEIVNLRQMMQRLKRISIGSRECVQALRCVAAQLECESGITTRFESDVDALLIPAAARVEVVRIVQEALANVRRHSGAKSAEVELTSGDGHYRIEIRDDGKGFDFAGRLSLLELDAQDKGPAIVKERVRLIGGELELESVPGEGSRLEIKVPCKKAPLGYHEPRQA